MKKLILILVATLFFAAGPALAGDEVTVHLTVENPKHYEGGALIVGWGISGPPKKTEIIKQVTFPYTTTIHAQRQDNLPVVYVSVMLVDGAEGKALTRQNASAVKVFTGKELTPEITYTAVLDKMP